MFKKLREITIKKSDKNITIKLLFPSGLEIYGFATENNYGGDWDYGATWNYLVMGDRPFLVDTGRFNMGGKLIKMIEDAGISRKVIEYIVICHGHEDHDGGLYEAAELTGKPVLAHKTYSRLVNFYPELAPPEANKNFPASCWHCFMPEFFPEQHCLKYHKERTYLKIMDIGNGDMLGEDIRIHHIPGHSPDSIAIQIGNEAIIVGDTVLPEITPFPSMEAFFYQVAEIMKPEYTIADSIYGLRAYIRSIKRLKRMGMELPDAVILPSHRLFHFDHWNDIDLPKRVDELIFHHLNRCAGILQIINSGPKTAAEIAMEHFPAKLLRGLGMTMGEHEVVSHCELLEIAGDLQKTGDKKFKSNGTANYQSLIANL